MLSAIKDLIAAVAISMVFAFSNGNQKWVWKQLGELRHHVIQESKQGWGCPSIFDKNACSTAPKSGK